MIKDDNKMKHEIQEVREELNNCISENGISDEPTLININKRLDELIFQWMNRSE